MALERGEVADLADGPGGNRLWAERCEDLFDQAPVGGPHFGGDSGIGNLRGAVKKGRQLVLHWPWQSRDLVGEDLAQLDKGGPEPLKGDAQADGA